MNLPDRALVGLSAILASLLIAGLHAWLPPPLPPDTSHPLSIERLVSSANHADELPEGQWLRTALPEAIDGRRTNGAPSTWYRLRLSEPPQWQRVGLVVVSENANAELWVDGVLYADETWAGRRSQRVHAPALLSAPRAAFARSGNEALLRLTGGAVAPRLITVRTGNASVIEEWQRWTRATVGRFLQLMTIGLFVFGLAACLVAAQDRSRTEYAWFGATLILWSLHCAWLLLHQAPLPMSLWQPVGSVSLLGFAVCAAVFLRRLSGRVASPRERVALAAALALCLTLALSSQLSMAVYAAIRHWLVTPLLLSIGAYLCWLIYRRGETGHPAPAASKFEIRHFAIPATVTFFVGLHDSLLGLGWLAAPRSLLQVSAPFVLIAFAALMLRRYLSALAQVESFNEELRQRIQEREHAIASEFRQRAAAENANAAQTERLRLLATACDPLRTRIHVARERVSEGASMAEAGRLIGSALEHMRLIIDAVDVADGGVVAALGNLRARLRRRLETAGIELDWALDQGGCLPASAEAITHRLLCVISAGIRHLAAQSGTKDIAVRYGTGQGQDRIWLELWASGDESCPVGDPGSQPTPDWDDAVAGLGADVTVVGCGYRIEIPLRAEVAASAQPRALLTPVPRT